jgi:hypothetical protein
MEQLKEVMSKSLSDQTLAGFLPVLLLDLNPSVGLEQTLTWFLAAQGHIPKMTLNPI